MDKKLNGHPPTNGKSAGGVHEPDEQDVESSGEGEVALFEPGPWEVPPAPAAIAELADVPPTSHPLDLVNAWAEDEPHDSLPLDDVLRNAPASERDMFRVPPTT